MKTFLTAGLMASLFLTAGCKMIPQKDPAPFTGPRTPENIRLHGNHLLQEPSLYLQQHAHNPIDWYPWGDEALNRAKTEDKPIFLSIGYSSCHWCHVMEHEVFEHDSVAAYMNRNFICIKVDREERPDLDAVYMEAVQMMTGRGGWPMSVFLTPELKPFYGATYIPKDQFMSLAGQIVRAFGERRGELNEQSEQVAQRIAASSNLETHDDAALNAALLQGVVDRAKEVFDPTNGGFQQSQKFPTPARWRFLLHEFRRSEDEELSGMLLKTLEAMQGGGIYDHVGGGFHRYTVDADWTVPHFEKMLYDNGQLAGLFIEAAVVFGRDDFLATGTDVLDFLMRDMRDQDGAFFASYDADSGGEEGTYYIWDRSNITTAVGKADGPVLSDILGVDQKGNFEHTGQSVLTRRSDLNEIAARHGRDITEVESLLAKHRDTLSQVRDQRTAPGLDKKIITSWNGLVISSLAQAFGATGRDEYLKAAEKATDFLLKHHRRDDGSLLRSSSEGRQSGEAILDDYAFFSAALLELYQVSGKTKHLQAASELIDRALADFIREKGGFHLTSASVEAPLGRRVEHFDSVIPSGSSVMLQNLIRLTAITGQVSYYQEAKKQLENQAGLMARAGFEMAWSCDAARKIVDPYYSVVIAGSDEIMFSGLMARLPAQAVVCRIPGKGPGKDLAELAPALQDKKSLDGKTTAYVCEFGTCQKPTTDALELNEQVFGDTWR